jgi:hypothetical protein
MNRILSFGVVTFMMISLSFPSFAEISKSTVNKRGVIDRVDLENRMIIVDDSIYWFKLNTKIINKKNKLLNRYALKKGQRVAIEAKLINNRHEMDLIVIYPNKS